MIFLQLPEEWKQREVLGSAPGNQWQNVREWHKTAPEEDQTWHWETFIYHEGGLTLEQASWGSG